LRTRVDRAKLVPPELKRLFSDLNDDMRLRKVSIRGGEPACKMECFIPRYQIKNAPKILENCRKYFKSYYWQQIMTNKPLDVRKMERVTLPRDQEERRELEAAQIEAANILQSVRHGVPSGSNLNQNAAPFYPVRK